jgi:hypothetical protein
MDSLSRKLLTEFENSLSDASKDMSSVLHLSSSALESQEGKKEGIDMATLNSIYHFESTARTLADLESRSFTEFLESFVTDCTKHIDELNASKDTSTGIKFY